MYSKVDVHRMVLEYGHTYLHMYTVHKNVCVPEKKEKEGGRGRKQREREGG